MYVVQKEKGLNSIIALSLGSGAGLENLKQSITIVAWFPH